MITIGHAQVYPSRRRWMERLAERTAQEHGWFRMVEVGSWVGESAILWARAAKRRTNAVRIYCIDPWVLYESLEVVPMRQALGADTVYATFMYNIAYNRLDGVIRPLRGTFQERWQDAIGPHALVYLDGDHAYAAVKQDLETAATVLYDGGYLCGDDLERQLHQVDGVECATHASRDGPLPYHAGVTLAVGEFFGREVSAYDGFWVMQKRGGGWTDVIL